MPTSLETPKRLRVPWTMPEKGPANAHLLSQSASCMDFHHGAEIDTSRHRRHRRRDDINTNQRQPSPGQTPYSSPLPQTQWTDVPPVYRPRNWVDPGDASPEAIRQSQHLDPMSAWRAQSTQGASIQSNRRTERRNRLKPPRIFRRQDSVESPQQQPFDVSMLYPQVGPYDADRMSIYNAPDHLEHAQQRFASQPNSPGFPPAWSALPSRSDEPSPMGLPRSPTYPPAGRRRMRSASGIVDAAFQDEQDFRLFVEATAGLPSDIDFSHPRSGQSPTSTSQPHLRRAATTHGTASSEMSPVADTPTTMTALREMAAIPQANQTYRPQRAAQPAPHHLHPRREEPHTQPQQQSQRPARPQPTRSDTRDRLAASASGLDLWLPSPVSPATLDDTAAAAAAPSSHALPRRPVGSSTAPVVSPLTPAALDLELERQLEELELGDAGEEEIDDELPDYAQSQAEAQAERRAEAARRARELQERWLRRGR